MNPQLMLLVDMREKERRQIKQEWKNYTLK